MVTLPPVWTMNAEELRDAAQRVRVCVGKLSQPRIYHLAVMLSVLAVQGKVTAWSSWDTPPPTVAKNFGRNDLINAMWALFGTRTDSLLEPETALVSAMGNPTRVLLDPFYDAKREPDRFRLVGNRKIGTSRADSGAVALGSPYWVWAGTASATLPAFREYNPDNSRNQQNGVRCALPAIDSLALAPHNPGSLYTVSRTLCPRRHYQTGSDPVCALNGDGCGGQGDGAARTATKPRLLAPPVPGAGTFMLLPNSLARLVSLATGGDSTRLPKAKDLAVLASWCHTNGNGPQGPMRLINVLGQDGIQLLSSTI